MHVAHLANVPRVSAVHQSNVMECLTDVQRAGAGEDFYKYMLRTITVTS